MFFDIFFLSFSNPGPWLPTPKCPGNISYLSEEKKKHRFSRCPTEKDNMLPSQKLTYAIQGVVGKMSFLFRWDILIVPWRVKFTVEVSEFLVPQVWLINGAVLLGFVRFPKMKQGTFLMSTPRTVRSWRNLANRWKTKLIIFVVFCFDWLEKVEIGRPKTWTDSYQKSHLQVRRPFTWDHFTPFIT